MNIFSSLQTFQNIRHKREIILLFSEDFCDFDLLRETIHEFNYEKYDIGFILHTQLLSDKQESILASFLIKELGSYYKSINYIPHEYYTQNGQRHVKVYHRHLECYIFTSDPIENDIKELNCATKKIVGWSTIVRRLTQEEIKKRIKQDRNRAIKDIITSVGKFLFVIAFFSAIILSYAFYNDLKEIIVTIFGIGLVIFIFLIVWSFVSDDIDNGWSFVISILKAIGIVLIIFVILFIIGYLTPDGCSDSINDAHRPDRF